MRRQRVPAEHPTGGIMLEGQFVADVGSGMRRKTTQPSRQSAAQTRNNWGNVMTCRSNSQPVRGGSIMLVRPRNVKETAV